MRNAGENERASSGGLDVGTPRGTDKRTMYEDRAWWYTNQCDLPRETEGGIRAYSLRKERW